MGEALLIPSSLGHYLQMGSKLQAYDLIEMLYLNLHFTTWWRSPLDVIHHELYEIFLLMQAHGKIPYHKITWYPLVYLLALCVDPLFVLWLDQPYIFSSFFIMMMSWRKTWMFTLFFFKTYLQYAQLSHDQSSDIHMNSTLVITWSSWIQHMDIKHCLWTNSTSVTQCNH